jgi:cytochrome c oxidase subunit 3
MAASHDSYYLPNPSRWPITGSIGLFCLLGGFAMLLNDSPVGKWAMIIGAVILVHMLFGWFGTVIRESESGTYNEQVDVSFRWGMGWFIFSEVLFFAAFFGALFYIRVLSVPWLGGEGAGGVATGPLLWPGFDAVWPTNGPENVGGAFETIPALGLPALNTLLLLSSGVTVTIAHHMLKHGNRTGLCVWLFATIVLGLTFLGVQGYEFYHAHVDLNLSLASGAYGSTFFMLTGFHGLHVTIGAIMLSAIFARSLKGHFTPTHHFGFEAVAWYWHFVDVVWLGLFIFVYWL